jgi:hypothetical protein
MYFGWPEFSVRFLIQQLLQWIVLVEFVGGHFLALEVIGYWGLVAVLLVTYYLLLAACCLGKR